ncbi:MAG: ParB/RepB/Spo0J family partition protein [Gammaproteobacteria bacterium]
MSSRHRSLGRGLDALLSKPANVSVGSNTVSEEGEFRQIPVDLLQRGQFQPRMDMRSESLEELAESIQAQGVVQPIVIRPLEAAEGENRYEIIAGERRWRAAQIAGLQEIPAIIRDVPDDAAVAMSLIENIQRENLNPLEEARALDRLIKEFDMTHQKAADAVGRSRAAVSNLLRLLDLSGEVKKLVEKRQLEMGHARALLGLTDQNVQATTARTVVARGLSVRQTEGLVKRVSTSGNKKKPGSGQRDPDICRLETDLGEKLGASVKLQHQASGKGRLSISYNSLDELEGILSHIR